LQGEIDDVAAVAAGGTEAERAAGEEVAETATNYEMLVFHVLSIMKICILPVKA